MKWDFNFKALKKKFCNFGIKLDISFTFSFEAHTAADGKNYKTNFYNLDELLLLDIESIPKRQHNLESGLIRF